MNKTMKRIIMDDSRTGRQGQKGGRYGSPHNDAEDRFKDRQGRERYDDGRYAPMDSAGNPDGGENYPYYNDPYYPPYYQGKKRDGRSTRESEKPMNKIGFAIDGEMERVPNEFPEAYPMSMDHRKGSPRIAGYADGTPDITKEMAMEWSRSMENEDGTQGPHWTMEQTKQVQAQQGIECDPIEFYLAINMMYSDYVKVAKKLGVNKVEFYACMAKAFLDDRDAGPDKLGRYFEYVVGD